MHSLISARELGQIDGLMLRRYKATKRANSMELSSDKNMEQVFQSGVNSLDLEKQDNRYLIACSSQSKLAIFDIYTEFAEANSSICKSIASLDRTSNDAHQFSIETVQWYPHDNGMFLTSSMDQSLKIWDSNTLQVAEEFTFSDSIYCHRMSNVAKKHCLVAVASDAARVVLCDLKTGSSTHFLRGHSQAVLSLSWSNRNDYILASGSRDNKVLLWDVRKASGCVASLDQYNGKGVNRATTGTTAHNGHVNGLSFTTDGLHVLSYGSDDYLRLWDVFRTENTLVNYGMIKNVSKKSVQLATSDGLTRDLVFVPSDKNIIVFEIFTGKRVAKLSGHYGNVNCCYYDNYFQELYSGGVDTNLLLWTPCGIASRRYTKEQVTKTPGDPDAHEDAWSSDED